MASFWALEWRSKNRLDGERKFILWENCRPLLFDTREEAREYANREYGYIKIRKDLRVEPHGWRFPRPLKVVVAVEAK